MLGRGVHLLCALGLGPLDSGRLLDSDWWVLDDCTFLRLMLPTGVKHGRVQQRWQKIAVLSEIYTSLVIEFELERGIVTFEHLLAVLFGICFNCLVSSAEGWPLTQVSSSGWNFLSGQSCGLKNSDSRRHASCVVDGVFRISNGQLLKITGLWIRLFFSWSWCWLVEVGHCSFSLHRTHAYALLLHSESLGRRFVIKQFLRRQRWNWIALIRKNALCYEAVIFGDLDGDSLIAKRLHIKLCDKWPGHRLQYGLLAIFILVPCLLIN